MKNVNSVVECGLCTSCGICVSSCNHNAINFDKRSLVPHPYVDDTKCRDCRLCLKVCPGVGVDLIEESKIINNCSICEGGRVLDSYIGYSLDEEIRYKSSSGGILTQFLCYLLEKKIISGAVVTDFNPIKKSTESFIAYTKNDIIKARGSKYVVTPLDEVIKQLQHAPEGEYVIVGLPCHIEGLRKLIRYNVHLRKKIVGLFGIYCSVNKTRNAISYYYWKHKIQPLSFSFRTDGCMGYMKLENEKEIKRVPYVSYWHGTHSFFCNERCSLCNDHFAELADISFGDINIYPYNQDKIGINSIVVRSEYWNRILLEASKCGYIYLQNIAFDEVLNSQKFCTIYKKGAGIQAALRLRKWLHKPIPQHVYSKDCKISLVDYIKSLLCMAMRKIGQYEKSFILINLFDRSKSKSDIIK